MIASAANANIARHLGLMATSAPTIAALKIPRGRTPTGDIDYLTLTFAELAAEVAAWQKKLTDAGIQPGDRTLVMVRQGLPLIAAAFALFSLGAVPVVIDPGMGLKNFLTCVERSRPRALVGLPLARLLSHVCRRAFATVNIRIPASGSLTARLTLPGAPFSAASGLLVQSRATDLAAILFTSGSTGAPKGVVYEHGHFDAQVRLIRATYDIRPGEIGEIIATGPVVTRDYDALPVATALAKISSAEGTYHRLGDCGTLDTEGRLWFCGRKAERVITAQGILYTELCEQVFRSHARANRCALIGLGRAPDQIPAIVIETNVRNSDEAHALARELRALALAHPYTAAIQRFYFHPAFPVDVRHNAKIHRLTLTVWAATVQGYDSDSLH